MGNKLKTRKAIAKRFKVTKNNKLKHNKAGRRHLLTNKGNATKRNKFGKTVEGKQAKNLKKEIPYKLR